MYWLNENNSSGEKPEENESMISNEKPAIWRSYLAANESYNA